MKLPYKNIYPQIYHICIYGYAHAFQIIFVNWLSVVSLSASQKHHWRMRVATTVHMYVQIVANTYGSTYILPQIR